MKNIIVIILACALFASCGDSANNSRPSTQYEEKKASIGDMEKESPLTFLKVSGSHRKNIINQDVVEGEVVNKATFTTYKNITLQINFLDKEGASIEKQKHTLDYEVKPGSTTDFKIKVKVKGASSVQIDIVDAVADK
jgi:hypothetical protein